MPLRDRPRRLHRGELRGPRGSWLAGNLEAFDRDRLGFLMRARRDFGDLVRFDARTTIVNEVGLARTVLKGPDSRFRITEDFAQRRLTAPEIESILAGRSLLNPGLRRSVVAGVTPLIQQLTAEILASSAGRTVDPTPLLEQVTSRAVAVYYFGPDGADLPAGCTRLLDALSEVIGNPFALPATWRTPARRRIDEAHKELHRRVVDLLLARINGTGKHQDGAATMIRGAFSKDSGVTIERLANLIIGAMLAAHRVPAAGTSWLLMELADRPAELHAVRAELRDARCFAESDPTPRDLHQIPQLLGCVNESLRLHPPTWLIARRSACEVKLAGRTFPAGHHFIISPYVLGRDERIFPKAENFEATRWRGTPAAATSLPFGSGPHGCPGSHLATVMLATIAAVAVSQFEIERCHGSVVPNTRSTLLPEGLRMRFHPRVQLTLAGSQAAFNVPAPARHQPPPTSS